MWGCYDPIGLDLSDPKKWGLYGCSVTKYRFVGQNWALVAILRPAMRGGGGEVVVTNGVRASLFDLIISDSFVQNGAGNYQKNHKTPPYQD